MRLEDDPSIGAVACPYCGAAKGVPCEPVNGSWIARDRKYVKSHLGRLTKASREFNKISKDRRRSKKARADAADKVERLDLEILNRRRSKYKTWQGS